MLAPNKQNLLLLKDQKKTMQSGYKLLKEKQTGLILTFLDFARQGKALEQSFSGDFAAILDRYSHSLTFVSSQDLIDQIERIPSMELKAVKKRVSGAYIEDLQLKVKVPERNELKYDISSSLTDFGNYFQVLIQLSQLKLNCAKIAEQILKVNRQIANLEIKLEDLDVQAKYIQNVLSEKENLEKAVLIKLFG